MSVFDNNTTEYRQFEYAVNIIGDCTEDYLFFFDLEKDYFSILKTAVEKYNFPSAKFSNSIHVLKNIIYKKDFKNVTELFVDVVRGNIDEINFDIRFVARDGNLCWVNCGGKVIRGNDESNTHIIGRISELGERKNADNVTGFRTQVLFERDYNTWSMGNHGSSGFVMRIGIDNFRDINEKYGYEAGDGVLRSLANCLIRVVPSHIRIYRMEGDEFSIFYNEDLSDEAIGEIFQELRKEIEKSSAALDYAIFYTISAGVMRIGNKNLSYEALYRKSEFALSCAKKQGKNSICFFDEKKYSSYMYSLEVQEELRQAVKNDFNGFYLVFQPIISSPKNIVAGAEALLRWNSSRYGVMSPAEFIPLLEDSGLIIPVGRFVYRSAIEQCKRWLDINPDFIMHINLSYIQLQKSDIIDEITQFARLVRVPVDNIVLELTESGEIETHGKVRETVEEIYHNGIGLAIDDFGTGYSNMRYLRDMQVNTLKIDRAFVVNSTIPGFDYNLIKSFTDLAHSVDIKICLEGVETKEQLDALTELNPDYIQGFYFGKPVVNDEFKKVYLSA